MSLVDDLVPHMRRVQLADRDLQNLGQLWQMIEAASAISCPLEVESILPTLTGTRVQFTELQSRLVRQLGEETLAQLGDELASSAQCTIDILVRNLYERTADVGFLATDDVLRAYCAATPAQRTEQRAACLERLAEYRAKYSVYDDVVLLAPDGALLARLDAGAALEVSRDPVVAQALARPGHVERFGPSDLADGGAPALLYAHRIDGDGGRCVGVLVLRFRNADELERIFASVGDGGQRVALLLVDAENRVIVSNDEAHVPLGARLPAAPDGELSLCAFAGREYVSVTCATRGYQGYRGPGWRARAMVSLLTAFRGGDAAPVGDDDAQRVALDNDALRAIQAEVDTINRNLRRVVWNGHVMADAGGGDPLRLKAVLEQVNGAGTRTRDRVAAAIGDLYRTSLGRARHQSRELARLAADIMDRNLYERANDCRWWALSPVLQRALAAPPSAAATQALGRLLGHINGLYTVYLRLVAFDAQGSVRGVSHEIEGAPLVGTSVDAGLLGATQALADSQRYAVSAFGASALSGGMPTYVYSAAVRERGRVVGGIALVFNAEREFRAILDDVLGERAGIAAFVGADGRVVASSGNGLAVGTPLPFDGTAALAEHADTHYAVAAVAAEGYREFKCRDGYRNGVRAVVALRLGSVERRRTALHDRPLRALPTAPRQPRQHVALFQTGPARYALPAAAVLEARGVENLVRTPRGASHAVGLLEVPAAGGARVIPVYCARSLFGVDRPARAGDGVVLVIAAPHAARRPLLGLRVDDVLSVADVGSEHLQAAPAGLRQHAPWIAALLRMAWQDGGAGQALVQLIDVDPLAAALGTPALEPEVATA
jgi:chemotaxis signal transduction protein